MSATTDNKPNGVRGWLLVLCIFFSVLYPSSILAGSFATEGLKQLLVIYPGGFRFFAAVGILEIGLAVFSMYAGLSLWRVVPNAVRTARCYLAAEAASALVPLLLPGLLGLSDFPEDLSNVYLLEGLMTFVYASVWFSYLSKSKRVRNTYFEGTEKAAD